MIKREAENKRSVISAPSVPIQKYGTIRSKKMLNDFFFKRKVAKDAKVRGECTQQGSREVRWNFYNETHCIL